MDPKITPPADDKNGSTAADSPQVSVDLQSVDATPPTAPVTPDSGATFVPTDPAPADPLGATSLNNPPAPDLSDPTAPLTTAPSEGLAADTSPTAPAPDFNTSPDSGVPTGLTTPPTDATPGATPFGAPAGPTMPDQTSSPVAPDPVHAGLPATAPVPTSQGHRMLLVAIGLLAVLTISVIVAFVLA